METGKNTPEHWLLGISPEVIGTVGMANNFAVTMAVTMFTNAPPQEVQDNVESIRYPSLEQHPEAGEGI